MWNSAQWEQPKEACSIIETGAFGSPKLMSSIEPAKHLVG